MTGRIVVNRCHRWHPSAYAAVYVFMHRGEECASFAVDGDTPQEAVDALRFRLAKRVPEIETAPVELPADEAGEQAA